MRSPTFRIQRMRPGILRDKFRAARICNAKDVTLLTTQAEAGRSSTSNSASSSGRVELARGTTLQVAVPKAESQMARSTKVWQ